MGSQRRPSQCLDFRALTDDQLRTAEAIFNEFRDKNLKPPTSRTPTPTAPSWTGASSATSSASTRTPTPQCDGSPPSGAQSRRSTAARRGQGARRW